MSVAESESTPTNTAATRGVLSKFLIKALAFFIQG